MALLYPKLSHPFHAVALPPKLIELGLLAVDPLLKADRDD